MIGVLAAVGVALVATPSLAARWGRRLHPADWARWVALALAAGAIAVELALLLAAAPTVLRAAGAHGLAAACAQMAGATPPGGTAVGWAAAAAAFSLPSLSFVSWRVGRRTQRRVAAAAALAPSIESFADRVRIVTSAEPAAFSVPTRDGGHVVVSSALVEALSDEQLAAVVHHEEAHLRHRHGSYLLLAAALDVGLGVHPLVRSSTAQLRCALERWADEHSAGRSEHSRATTRAALLAAALAPLPAAVMGFGPIDTIVSRATALEQPAPRTGRLMRLSASMPLCATVLIGALAAGTAGGNLWSALTMPVNCPLR